MSYALLSAVILAAGIASVVLSPLFFAARTDSRRSERRERQDLLDARERCVQSLRDLRYDHSTGQISDGQFSELEGELGRELNEIIAKLDSPNH